MNEPAIDLQEAIETLGQTDLAPENTGPAPNGARGFQTFSVKADASPGTPGRRRKVGADVADLRAIEAPITELPPDDAERAEIEDTLLECGCTPTEDLLNRLDTLMTRFAFRRCAEALRHLVRSLGTTPAGRALERALLGRSGKSFAKDAAEVGCTKQNLAYHEKTVRRRLFHLTAGTMSTTTND